MIEKLIAANPRRKFLKHLGLGGGLLLGGLCNNLITSKSFAAHIASVVPKTLVNIMLYGGSDLRFVFAPAPASDPVYIDQYWNARRNLYDGSYSSYADMFANEYTLVTDPVSGTVQFGIHNAAGWLSSQFSVGNVAIISNTYASLNRSHDHSQLMVLSGDLQAPRTRLDRAGWGGRLVESMTGLPNVVELSDDLQLFCNGSDSSFRLAQVIHAANAREMGLPNPDPDGTSRDDAQIRALNAYYTARGAEIDVEKPAEWQFRRFFQHHDSLRQFGDLMANRLSTHPIPPLLDPANFVLNRESFAQQCRNIYDVCLAQDILSFRVLSMSYGGWDSHDNQAAEITPNIQDVLGASGGLATVISQLNNDIPSAGSNLVFNLSWDFGRQIAANGANGTDHGRGNHSILIGSPVQGGLYGDLFPEREANPDPADSQGRTPFEIRGRDIDGLTSLEHLWARTCEWLEPGTGNVVFPNYQSSPIETGVDLSNILV